MSKRLSATDKWDDDWFLELPPLMKVVWEYLRDNCDGGTGILKLSFKKMGQLVGAEISREEFDQHMGSRVEWINHDSIWIPAFLVGQFKKLSPNNLAHVNMAKKVVSITADRAETFSERSISHLEALKNVIREYEEHQATLEGDSKESHESSIGYRVQGKGQSESSNKKKVNQNQKRILNFENRFRFDFEALFDLYPRFHKKGEALRIMSEEISDEATYQNLKSAILRYRETCEREGTPWSKTLTFPNFWFEWEDWVDPRAGKSTIQPVEPESNVSEFLKQAKAKEQK